MQREQTPEQGLHKVLDVGTGTGEWAITFATSAVIAVVLSPNLMPAMTHPNCSFTACTFGTVTSGV
jgi:predicted RNA methylase